MCPGGQYGRGCQYGKGTVHIRDLALNSPVETEAIKKLPKGCKKSKKQNNNQYLCRVTTVRRGAVKVDYYAIMTSYLMFWTSEFMACNAWHS